LVLRQARGREGIYTALYEGPAGCRNIRKSIVKGRNEDKSCREVVDMYFAPRKLSKQAERQLKKKYTQYKSKVFNRQPWFSIVYTNSRFIRLSKVVSAFLLDTRGGKTDIVKIEGKDSQSPREKVIMGMIDIRLFVVSKKAEYPTRCGFRMSLENFKKLYNLMCNFKEDDFGEDYKLQFRIPYRSTSEYRVSTKMGLFDGLKFPCVSLRHYVFTDFQGWCGYSHKGFALWGQNLDDFKETMLQVIEKAENDEDINVPDVLTSINGYGLDLPMDRAVVFERPIHVKHEMGSLKGEKERVSKEYPKGIDTLEEKEQEQEKEQEKDQEKDKEKDKEKENR